MADCYRSKSVIDQSPFSINRAHRFHRHISNYREQNAFGTRHMGSWLYALRATVIRTHGVNEHTLRSAYPRTAYGYVVMCAYFLVRKLLDNNKISWIDSTCAMRSLAHCVIIAPTRSRAVNAQYNDFHFKFSML